jgi:Flp pilus assembly protein TadD
MGRSLAAIADTSGGAPTNVTTGLPIEDKGIEYTIVRRDGRVFHKATRRDSDGTLLTEIEAEVQYALGSGTRGTSFLIDRDGFLFLSPIAWFAQQKRWDISPGYGEFATRPTFERAIQPDCLFCHANQFRPVTGTLNRYETPIFQGHAIGCERCHGPGELHVKRAGQSTEPDLTIVNPATLAPPLRDSVCQQCHLQGSVRFTRAGRGPLDYRPGLPLHEFFAVFLMKKGNQGRFEAVGHDEQMENSRCFIESKGQLGCISCHDPHRLPEPTTKVAYYRDRCLHCHEKKGCALPSVERQSRGRADDCIACHMPRPAIANVPHTVATDHRVLRGLARAAEVAISASDQPGGSPLMDYHWSMMTEEERRDAARDMGVALGWAARSMRSSPRLAKMAATQGLPLLETALRGQPDDVTARESLAQIFGILDRPEDALLAFEAALEIEPRQESALRSRGRVLTRLHRPELARSVLQKLIAANPWQSDYRRALAVACFDAGDYRKAVAACREAIRLNPEFFEMRSLLVQCYLRSHQPDRAEAEFERLIRIYPASREVWQQWYEQQKHSSSGGAGSLSVGEPRSPGNQ